MCKGPHLLLPVEILGDRLMADILCHGQNHRVARIILAPQMSKISLPEVKLTEFANFGSRDLFTVFLNDVGSEAQITSMLMGTALKPQYANISYSKPDTPWACTAHGSATEATESCCLRGG